MAPEGGAENQRDPHRETTHPASKDRDAVDFFFFPHEPDILAGPGKHSCHLWVWLGQRYHTRRGQRSRVIIPGERALALRCSDRHLVVRGSTEGNGRCTPFCRAWPCRDLWRGRCSKYKRGTWNTAFNRAVLFADMCGDGPHCRTQDPGGVVGSRSNSSHLTYT